MASHILLFVVLLLVHVSLCTSAPGIPDFRDATVSAFGPIWLNTHNAPGFYIGGPQPMAIYWKLSYKKHPNTLFSFKEGVDKIPRVFEAHISPTIIVVFGNHPMGKKFVRGTTILKENRDYIIVLNYDGYTLSVYLDGKLEARGSGFTGATSSKALTFGVGDGNYVLPGFKIKRVALWRRKLSPQEISQ